jgi:hypothetical protein
MEWHAYQSILASIAPEEFGSWDFKATLRRLDLTSSKGLEAALNRSGSICDAATEVIF